MPDILVNTIVFAAPTLSGLLQIYVWIVIIATLLTWIRPDPYNPIVRTLYGMTEPVFDWVREHLPVYFGGLDLSPIVVIIATRVHPTGVDQSRHPGGVTRGGDIRLVASAPNSAPAPSRTNPPACCRHGSASAPAR